MVKYKFNCLYCDAFWEKEFWEIPDVAELRCPKCNDANVKKFRIDNADKYGYNLPWKKKDKKSDY